MLEPDHDASSLSAQDADAGRDTPRPGIRPVLRPFPVSTMGDAAAPPLIVLPGGPCRDAEYLVDLGGIGEDAPRDALVGRVSLDAASAWFDDIPEDGPDRVSPRRPCACASGCRRR
ncbi:hypothetical protein [Microbacterium sp.]|uniref:hypothetical protein n=1 Tax=Microbacterium sp. TaxID=51671 RepID=UPI003C72212B